MQFTLSSGALNSRLQTLARVINSKNTLSILDCFLFENKTGLLENLFSYCYMYSILW